MGLMLGFELNSDFRIHVTTIIKILSQMRNIS